MINNPWVNLPASAPYVLPQDEPVLDKYANSLVGPKNLRFDKLPLPYVGNPQTARIVLLALNGGFGEHDIEEQNNIPDYAAQFRKNLTFANKTSLFFLQPQFANTGGYKWWKRHLGEAIRKYGMEVVASRLACVQAFPYCSQKYERCLQYETLPSQEYTFALVRQAITDKKIIVIMRSREIWLRYVPELQTCEYIELANHNNPCLSENQTLPEQYERIKNALE